MFRGLLWVTAMLLIGVGVGSANLTQAIAKESAKPAGEKPKAKAVEKAKGKAKAKPAAVRKEARLPRFYHEVVTPEQRDAAARIFAKYNNKLAKLKADIKSANDEREQALNSLLSDSQKAKLAQLKADARKKGAKSAPKK